MKSAPHHLLVLAVFSLLLAVPCFGQSQSERCEASLEVKDPGITGPVSIKVGEENRYCVEVIDFDCGRCDGKACVGNLKYQWSLTRQLPDGDIGGDLHVVRGETLKCLDVEGKTAGDVLLLPTVQLICGVPKTECGDSKTLELQRKITVTP